MKAIEDVDLVIAWELGENWAQMFEAISYLDRDNVHLRNIHGATHSFSHAMTGMHAFEAIVLKDLLTFLTDPGAEEITQRSKLSLE